MDKAFIEETLSDYSKAKSRAFQLLLDVADAIEDNQENRYQVQQLIKREYDVYRGDHYYRDRAKSNFDFLNKISINDTPQNRLTVAKLIIPGLKDNPFLEAMPVREILNKREELYKANDDYKSKVGVYKILADFIEDTPQNRKILVDLFISMNIGITENNAHVISDMPVRSMIERADSLSRASSGFSAYNEGYRAKDDQERAALLAKAVMYGFDYDVDRSYGVNSNYIKGFVSKLPDPTPQNIAVIGGIARIGNDISGLYDRRYNSQFKLPGRNEAIKILDDLLAAYQGSITANPSNPDFSALEKLSERYAVAKKAILEGLDKSGVKLKHGANKTESQQLISLESLLASALVAATSQVKGTEELRKYMLAVGEILGLTDSAAQQHGYIGQPYKLASVKELIGLFGSELAPAIAKDAAGGIDYILQESRNVFKDRSPEEKAFAIQLMESSKDLGWKEMLEWAKVPLASAAERESVSQLISKHKEQGGRELRECAKLCLAVGATEEEINKPYPELVRILGDRTLRDYIQDIVTDNPQTDYGKIDEKPLIQQFLLVSILGEFEKLFPDKVKFGKEEKLNIAEQELSKRLANGIVNAVASPDSMMMLGATIDGFNPGIFALHGKAGLTILEQKELADANQNSDLSVIATLPIKAWRDSYRHMVGDGASGDWQKTSAMGLATVFGNEWKPWLDLQTKHGRNPHDATYWLPGDQPLQKLAGKIIKEEGEKEIKVPGLKDFLLKNVTSQREVSLGFGYEGIEDENGRPFNPLDIKIHKGSKVKLSDIDFVYGDDDQPLKLKQGYLAKKGNDFFIIDEAGKTAIENGNEAGYDIKIEGTEVKKLFAVEQSVREISELGIIARNWTSLTDEERLGSYNEILAVCQSRKYEGQRSAEFAKEAARWGVPQEDYRKQEDIYLSGLAIPVPFDTEKRFELGDGLVGRFLPRNDPRVSRFGQYTDCCQHLDGVGKDCAIETLAAPHSQLFVVENDEGRIIAGSWVWEKTTKLPGSKDDTLYKTACVDNVDIVGNLQDAPKAYQINEIYGQMAKFLADEQGYRKVTMGKAGIWNEGTQDLLDMNKLPRDVLDAYPVLNDAEKLPLPNSYRNADSRAKPSDADLQVLMAENPNAPAAPLEKTKAQVWVRAGYDADFVDMDKVAQKVYPEGWNQADRPDGNNSTVYLLMKDDPDAAKKSGVVGYAVIDNERKYIFDVAVEPDKTLRSYSTSLLTAVMQHCEREGGEWHMHARESTSYRLLEIMEKRGAIKLNRHGDDIKVGDETAYNVSFEIIPVKDRKAPSAIAEAPNQTAKPAPSGRGTGKVADHSAIGIARYQLVQ